MSKSAAAPARTSGPHWQFALALDRGRESLPLYLQIARAIVEDICRGRLAPGKRLPGARTLANSLGVHRVTVATAYDELAAEGWVTVYAARGVLVSQELPQRGPTAAVAPREAPATAPYGLAPHPVVEHSPEHFTDKLVFGGSSPDPRLLPVEPLARAYRRQLRRSGSATLRYGDAAGHPRLRTALAEMLSETRGLNAAPQNVFITRGSQMALTLVACSLLRSGEAVAVEALGYRHAWESFLQAGANLLPVPVDADGLDTAALARAISKQRIRAVYVTPHHQFPTTVTLAPHRRLQLLELARAHRFAIIEDDYDHEFHYDGRPVLPLASRDGHGSVIYVGTLSKVLAPGLRIGYVAGPRDLMTALAARREFLDMQGDHSVEAAVAELIEEGEVQRHVRRACRTYHARRDLLTTLLREQLSHALDFETPSGGIAIWVRVRKPYDVEQWFTRSLARGVAFQTARSFAFDRRPRPFARLGFASLNEEELRLGVARLRESLPAR